MCSSPSFSVFDTVVFKGAMCLSHHLLGIGQKRAAFSLLIHWGRGMSGVHRAGIPAYYVPPGGKAAQLCTSIAPPPRPPSHLGDTGAVGEMVSYILKAISSSCALWRTSSLQAAILGASVRPALAIRTGDT